MIGIELEVEANALKTRAMERGVLLNITQNRVIRLLPPLIIDDEQADEITDVVCTLVEEFG
jgi:acetylornithine aminotransferase